ncbi:MAG: hypothetical protein ACFCUR_11645 [Rhodomicrobiaceae bacterium]
MMGKKPTASKLRHDIDHGRAGSKVDAPDPAAAPLGTDAEAGGAPVTDEIARSAYGQEVADSPAAIKLNKPDGGRTIYLAAISIFAILVVLAAVAAL